MEQDVNTPINSPDDPHRIEASEATEQFDKAFRPKGATAFFVLLVILGLIIWYGIYFLMLQRI